MRKLMAALLAGALVAGIACSPKSTEPQSSSQSANTSGETSQAQQSQSTNQSSSGPSGAPAASGAAINEADVRKLAEAWAAAKSYRVKISGTSGQNSQAVEGTIEIVKPDRMRMKFTSSGQSVEIIRIGADSYTNIGGRWVKSPVAATGGFDTLTPDPDKVVSEFSANKASGEVPKKGNVVTVEGTQCQEWVTSDSIICVGTRDNLPRKFTPKEGGMTLLFSDWNAPITINAPV